jgi:hypothetical protein
MSGSLDRLSALFYWMALARGRLVKQIEVMAMLRLAALVELNKLARRLAMKARPGRRKHGIFSLQSWSQTESWPAE